MSGKGQNPFNKNNANQKKKKPYVPSEPKQEE
jgi:hypothetical protein